MPAGCACRPCRRRRRSPAPGDTNDCCPIHRIVTRSATPCARSRSSEATSSTLASMARPTLPPAGRFLDLLRGGLPDWRQARGLISSVRCCLSRRSLAWESGGDRTSVLLGGPHDSLCHCWRRYLFALDRLWPPRRPLHVGWRRDQVATGKPRVCSRGAKRRPCGGSGEAQTLHREVSWGAIPTLYKDCVEKRGYRRT